MSSGPIEGPKTRGEVILGSFLTNPDLLNVSTDLNSSDFPLEHEQALFSLISQQWEDSRALDEFALGEIVPGGQAYLQRIQTGAYRKGPEEILRDVINLKISLHQRRLYSFFEAQRNSVLSGHDPDFLSLELRLELEYIDNLKARLSSGLPFIPLSEITPRDIEWLWTSRLPLSMLTLFAGPEGAGKSLFSITLASLLSRGKELPDDPIFRAPVSSLFIVSEDPLHQAVSPRFIANSADIDRIRLLDFTSLSDEKDSVKTIRSCLSADNNIRLVVIDPLNNVASPKMRWGDDPSVRRYLLQPLIELAEETGIAVIGIVHFKKNREGQNPLSCIAGSLAYTAAARSVIGFTFDPLDPSKERRIAVSLKMNYTRRPASIAFSIQSGQLVSIEDKPLTGMDPDEAFSLGYKEQVELNYSDIWIKDFLSDGPRNLDDIEKEASKHNISRRTLFNSRRRLSIISKTDGFGAEKVSTWALSASQLGKLCKQ